MEKGEKAFLISVCIGDGHLRKSKESNSVSLRLCHGIKQKEYLIWKVERLRKILGGNECKIVEFNNNEYPGIKWEKSHKYLRIIRKWLYKDNVKTINSILLNKLDLQGVAIWWMDDGSMYFKKNSKTKKVKALEGILSTYISVEENQIIIDFFKQKYDIEFKIVKSKNSTRLRLNTFNCKKFQDLIEPYMHKSLLYKILK